MLHISATCTFFNGRVRKTLLARGTSRHVQTQPSADTCTCSSGSVRKTLPVLGTRRHARRPRIGVILTY